MKLWLAKIICDLTDRYSNMPLKAAPTFKKECSFFWINQSGIILARLWPADLRLVTYERDSSTELIFYPSGSLAQETVMKHGSMIGTYYDIAGNQLSFEEFCNIKFAKH